MAAFADIVKFETTLFLAVFALGTLGAVILGWFLIAMFRRSTIRRYLRQCGCEPIKIRWLILAWWCPWIPTGSPWFLATAFRVIYSDPNRLIHHAYCWVGYELGASLPAPRRIDWVKDEIIGELAVAAGLGE